MIISKDYKKNKEQVLSMYDAYVHMCEDSDKKVSESISLQAEKIRNEIFHLLVLGEAKSGKSTFINAYLGKEVLPMDARQCTSALIKIHKGNQFELKAKSAAGGTTTVTGEERIQNFLKKHATIPDEFRQIPITSIHEVLIKCKGKLSKGARRSFIEKTAKENANIYNMHITEYEKLINDYIDEKAAHWGKIITEIEITYPLPEEMQGITIIDSPGVGANGNVGKITEEYIASANAIVFVKSLSGQALESASFMNFLRNYSTNKNKEAVFLALTGKSNLQRFEFASLKDQALELYGNDIKEEKIIFVDSKMQLFLNKCRELGSAEKIDDFFEALERTENEFAPANYCFLKSKGDVANFYEKMAELSNFENAKQVLENFARVANYIQLIEFLENLEREYKRYSVICYDALKVARESAGDPTDLEGRITEKKNEIADVYEKLAQGITEICRKYTDNIQGEGIIFTEAERRQAEYEKKIKKYRDLSDNEITEAAFDELKKATMEAIEDVKDFRRDISNQIIDECNQKLIQYVDEPSKIPAEAYTPNFTETDFDRMNENARKETSGFDEVERGVTFTKVEKVSYYFSGMHMRLVVNSICSRLDKDIIPKMTENIVNYVLQCKDAYTQKLAEHKQELEGEYQKLLEDRDNSEKRWEKCKL